MKAALPKVSDADDFRYDIKSVAPEIVIGDNVGAALSSSYIAKGLTGFEKKKCLLVAALLLPVIASCIIAPNFAVDAIARIIEWRNPFLFTYSSVDLCAAVTEKSETRECCDITKTARILSSSLNWLGLLAATGAFLAEYFHHAVLSLSWLNLPCGVLFTVAETSNLLYQFNKDSELINKIKYSEGPLKTESLQYANRTRWINGGFNSIRVASTVLWLILPFVGLTNPLSATLMIIGLSVYLAAFALQKLSQTYRASQFDQNHLFAKNDLPENSKIEYHLR